MTSSTPPRDAEQPGYAGSYQLPGFGLTRQLMDGADLPDELVPEILELLRICFNGGPHWFAFNVDPAAHLRWRLKDFPHGTEVKLTVEDGGRLVGFVGGFHRRWLLEGDVYVARDGVDLCRLPEWQGRGVMRALRPFSERERHPRTQFGFGWVTHPADRHLSLERGNRGPANEAHDFVRMIGPPWARAANPALRRQGPSHTAEQIRREEESGATRLRQLLEQAWAYLRSLLMRRPFRVAADLEIASIEQFDARFDELCETASRPFQLIQERTAAYLNWRYADERAGPFVVRTVSRDGQLVGYAATRLLAGRAHLADLLCLPGETHAAEALIRDSLALARAAGCRGLWCRLPERHPYRPALRRAGFIDLGARAGELFDPHALPSELFDFLDDPDARVHITYGDSDTV